MKGNINIGFTFAIVAFVASISNSIVFAATTMPPTRGEKMLENMVNAEAARVAELKVQLNPRLGINHTLRKKSTGNAVKLLQQFLKVYGVYPEGLITGYFGPLTERAVKKFQEKELIDSVGIAGPKTRTRIVEISRQKSKGNLTLPISRANSSTPTSSVVTTLQIMDAVLATDVGENGAAIAPVTSFASATQNIYAVLSLKNATQDTQIGYIRYYGNTYIDSGVSHPSRSNLTYFHFQWSLKPSGNRSVGNYSIVFYVNGKSAKTIQYAIY